MKFSGPCLLIPILFLFTGCDAVLTKNPVAERTDDLLQDKLSGAWHREGRSFELQFDNDGLGHIGAVEWVNGDYKLSRAQLIAAEVDGETYLSLQPIEEDEEIPGWFLSLLDAKKDDEFRIYIPDMEKVSKLVEEGKVAGKVKKSKYSTEITVESAEAILKAARPVEEFFDMEKPLKLYRLPDIE